MATLKITEYRNQILDSKGRPLQAGEEPATTVQSVTFSTTTQSSALKKETRFVELLADSDYYIAWGASPSATTSGQLYRKGVPVFRGVDASSGEVKIAAVAAASNMSTPITILDSTGDSCMDDVNNAVRVNVVAGTTGSTQYTEDVASVGAESLMLAGAIRRDTAASSSGTDGDYSTINTDALGRIWVNASGAAVPVTDNGGSLTVDSGQLPASLGQTTMAASLPVALASNQSALPITDNSGSLTVDGTVAVSGTVTISGAVTNAGTFATQDSQVVADNGAFTDGTTKVFAAGFIYDEVAGTGLTENDACAARIDIKRAQIGVLEDATTRGQRAAITASGALKVDLSATAANAAAVKVDGSAVTQPISGTVTANAGTGSFTVVQATAANLNATVTGTVAVTQSGAWSLSANQSVNVAQINGVTPLMGSGATGTGSPRVTIATDGQGQLVDNAAFTDGTTRVDVAGFIFDETAGTALTENDAAAARIDSKRAQVGVLEDATTRGQRAAVSAAGALKVDGSAVTQPVSIATAPVLVAGSAIIGKVGIDQTTPGTTNGVQVNAALPAGTNSIGTVQPGNTANTTPWLVQPMPGTSGGLSISRVISAATTNATSVKASAGQVYSIYAHNVNAAVRFLKLYNKASAPTVGTDTPVLTLPIPGNAAGAGFVWDVPSGIAFGTGIALAITAVVTDADTTAVAANEIVVNLLYK